MTTAETVIPSALLQTKDYDLFKCVKSSQGFLSALDLAEPFRFRLGKLEGSLIADLKKKAAAAKDADAKKKSAADGSAGAAPADQTADRGFGGIRAGTGGEVDVTDYVAEVTLTSLGQPIGEPLRTAHSVDGTWEEWFFFPINICQLPLDASVCVTIHCAHYGVIGTCVFHPFSFRGELKVGTRRYPVKPGTYEETMTAAARARKEKKEQKRERRGGFKAESDPDLPLFDDWSEYLPSPDWDKLERDFRQGRMTKIPWMDKFAEEKLSQLQNERQVATDCSMIVVDFPAASNRLPIFHLSVPPDFDALAASYQATPSPFVPYYDLDANMENLSETKAATLAKSLHMVGDKEAKPSFQQTKVIKKILSHPPIRMDTIKVDDSALLWQFRHWLLRESEGFVPFMQCVDWTNDAERAEAEILIPKWRELPVEDALFLLSRSFRTVLPLRLHAVSTLSRLSDANLCVFLLQLVQGCRYDIEAELANFLVERATTSWPLCSSFFWYVTVEEEVEKAATATRGGARQSAHITQARNKLMFTDLKKRLLRKLAEENPEFKHEVDVQVEYKNTLVRVHGQVIKEPTKDRKKRIVLLKDVLNQKTCGLAELFTAESPERVEENPERGSKNTLNEHKILRSGRVLLPTHPTTAVDDVLSDDVYIFKSAKQPLKIPFKIQTRNVKLGQQGSSSPLTRDEGDNSGDEDEDHHGLDSTLPGIAPDMSIVLAATTRGSGAASLSNTKEGGAISESQRIGLMWKSGDDVRQDQLVIQMIELVDDLLKQNGLDLCLTPYRVLATSPQDGFVEVVPKVATLQDVQKETVFKYLMRNNDNDAAKVEVAMGRFVKSCAGYCVITFLLGIGDRHLENLLITTDGRLFHIDFGFILGKDPKPFPPPMKLNKEMIDAMGGPNSMQYKEFKRYMCSAYNILRKHARLLLHLLLLMVDAGIPDISDGKVDPRIGLMKVQDKLRLELNDAEGTQYIQEVVNTASAAFFTNVWDFVHEAVQGMRK